MSIEVFPVKGPHKDKARIAENKLWVQSPDNVAEEIQRIYALVEDRSGEIIAAHTLRIASNDRNARLGEYLFLVAEIPDLKTE